RKSIRVHIGQSLFVQVRIANVCTADSAETTIRRHRPAATVPQKTKKTKRTRFQKKEKVMKKSGSIKNSASRRRFLQNGMVAAGAVTMGFGILPDSLSAFAQGGDNSGGTLSRGDASILRFLLAAEILESDLWEQYWELSSAAGIAHRGDFASKIKPSPGEAPVGPRGEPPPTPPPPLPCRAAPPHTYAHTHAQ